MEPEIVEPKTRRRSEIGIIVEVLSHLKGEPSRKQRIMGACNISNNVLKGYLAKLIKGGIYPEKLWG